MPTESVGSVEIEILSYHANIQLQAIMPESGESCSIGTKGELKNEEDLYHMMILDASYTFPAEQS